MVAERSDRILVIRLSSLGDVILTTPVIRSLRKQFRTTRIDFMVREQFADVYKHNPYINELITYKKDIDPAQYKKYIREKGYDTIIDLQNNLRSRKLYSGLDTKIYRFDKPHIKKFLLVRFKINRFREIIPVTERYAASFPGSVLDGKGPEIFIEKKNIAGENKTVGLCPGSKHFTKMYPEEYYIELGNKLTGEGFTVKLFGGKDDREICSRLTKGIPGSTDLSNDNDLLETCAGIKTCEAVICNDSGLMHTATACGVPVAAIFGSTVREFGFAPYKSQNIILENKSLTCRPCSHIGKDVCPKGHFKCMRELTPDMVFNEFIKFYGSL